MTVYLISWIGDNFFYNKFRSEFGGLETYPALFFKIVPLNFILCILASIFINKAVRLISSLIMKPLFRICDKNKSAFEINKVSISAEYDSDVVNEKNNATPASKL